MKYHTFKYDGLEGRVRVLPRNAMVERGIDNLYFSTHVPRNSFPDVHEEVPGLSVMSFKVRCQRRHHKILVWPNGRMTLTAHMGKQGKQAAKVAEMMGQCIRCFDVLTAWREALNHRVECSSLPKPLQPVLMSVFTVKNSRRMREYQERKADAPVPFSKRINSTRKSRLTACIDQWFESGVSRTPEIEARRTAFREVFLYGSAITSNVSHESWSRLALCSGIAQSRLLLRNQVVLATVIPPDVPKNGRGWVLVRGDLGKRGFTADWVYIEQTGSRLKSSAWKIDESQGTIPG